MLETLKKARSFIEQGWTQCYYARAADGTIVPPLDPRAVCWCVLGACRRAVSSMEQFHKLTDTLRKTLGDGSLVDWNDTRESKEEVLALFDKAIANA